jgi:hypothetical protein
MNQVFIPFSQEYESVLDYKKVVKRWNEFVSNLTTSLQIKINKENHSLNNTILNDILKTTLFKVYKEVYYVETLKAPNTIKKNKENSIDNIIEVKKEVKLEPKNKIKKEKASIALLNTVVYDDAIFKKPKEFDFNKEEPVSIRDKEFWIISKFTEEVSNKCRTFLIEGNDNIYVNHKLTHFIIEQTTDKPRKYYLFGEYNNFTKLFKVVKDMDNIKIQWAKKCGLEIRNEEDYK